MGIRLSDDEVWDFLERGHTGILTTLRGDGWPVSLPVWFAVLDRLIYVGTPAAAKKIGRIRRDERAAFLVETGEAWVDLAAVQLPVLASLVPNGPEAEAANNLLNDKYADFRPASARRPTATNDHYAKQRLIRLEPAGRALSWDNSRIRLLPPS